MSPIRHPRALAPTATPRRRGARWLVAPTFVGLLVAGCGSDPGDAAPTATSPSAAAPAVPTTTPPPAVTAATPDLVGTALINHVFTELAGLVVDAGLVDTLRDGTFTVFAPTDDAFAELPHDVLRGVQDDQELLTTVLTYHVVPGELRADDLVDGELETVSGMPLTISHDDDGTVLVDGHPIVTADIEASNGIVHVMDAVLVPET